MLDFLLFVLKYEYTLHIDILSATYCINVCQGCLKLKPAWLTPSVKAQAQFWLNFLAPTAFLPSSANRARAFVSVHFGVFTNVNFASNARIVWKLTRTGLSKFPTFLFFGNRSPIKAKIKSSNRKRYRKFRRRVLSCSGQNFFCTKMKISQKNKNLENSLERSAKSPIRKFSA